MPAPARPSAAVGSTVVGGDDVVTAHSNLFGTVLDIDFRNHPSDTSSALWVTVDRAVAGVDIGRVRGLDDAPSIGAVTIGYDHEAPLGVPVTYTATARNDAGTATWTAAPVVITVPAHRNRAWLKSLANPARSVLLTGEAYPDWQREAPMGVFRPPNREDPVTRRGVRQYGTGTLTLQAITADEIAALDTLLLANEVYLLQADADNGRTRPDVYVAIGTDQFAQPAPDPEYRSVPLPVVRVRRPSTVRSRVTLPGHSIGDTAARYGAIGNYPSPLIRWMRD